MLVAMARKLTLVCYDVSDDARRSRALRVSRRYASGGQKSVHECWLSAAETADVLHRMDAVVDARIDRVLLVRLDPRRQILCLGAASAPQDQDLILVGA